MELPVTFKNRNGSRLFGMLYSPDRPVEQRVGVLISVNAVKYRIGTFRLHVLLARKFCELGFFVLTFDPEGIGDSEGPFENKLLSEHFYDIQTGKYSGDLADAMNYFFAAAQIDRMVLFGLCGGAVSVQMAGACDPRVQGLIQLNLPVLIEDLKRRGQPDNAGMIVSATSAKSLLKHKLQRLVEVNFWRRLLSLQVDLREELRLVGRSLQVLGKRVGEKVLAVTNKASARKDTMAPVSSHRLFNMHVQRAFLRSMELRQQTLFMFAELDPWTAIFNSEFREGMLVPGNPHEAHYTIEVIAAANHIFSSTESQRELETRLSSWLLRHFPVTNCSTVSA